MEEPWADPPPWTLSLYTVSSYHQQAANKKPGCFLLSTPGSKHKSHSDPTLWTQQKKGLMYLHVRGMWQPFVGVRVWMNWTQQVGISDLSSGVFATLPDVLYAGSLPPPFVTVRYVSCKQEDAVHRIWPITLTVRQKKQEGPNQSGAANGALGIDNSLLHRRRSRGVSEKDRITQTTPEAGVHVLVWMWSEDAFEYGRCDET